MVNLIDFILHVDKYLMNLISSYASGIYLILFAVIFLETGLVVTPFLPGDSLVFTAGAFAANGVLNIYLLFTLFCLAAIIGDSVNYWIGEYLGEKFLKKIGFLRNSNYLNRAENFYEKQGSKAIVIGRFIPIIRTFVPFVAGVSKMQYSKFLIYNIVGGILWASLFLFGGFFFGGIPFVKQNFGIIIIILIIISLIPLLYEIIKNRKENS